MNLGEQILEMVEEQVKSAVDQQAEPLMNALLDQLAKVIPGGIDDAIIAGAKPVILPVVKAELMKLAEKINSKD